MPCKTDESADDVMADQVESLTEYVANRGVTLAVDQEKSVIRGVKILGRESANGRNYPIATLQRAVSLYEAVKVNVDHPPRDKPDGPRSYQDRIGQIHSPRLTSDGVYGDLHYNPKHPIAEQLAWDAGNSPENVGLSHNVQARTTRRRDGRLIVEEIVAVNSVDLVADPATTAGLFEQADDSKKQEVQEMDWKEVTLEEVRAKRPDLVKTLTKAAIAEQADSEEQKRKEAEFKTLKEELDKYKAKEAMAEKRAKVDEMLTEAKLPKELVTDVFRQTLEEAKDDGARKALIEDRAKLAAVGKGGPQSREQRRTEGTQDPAGDFAGVVDGKSCAAALLE